MIQCARCGRLNDDTQKYCAACGSWLPDIKPESRPKKARPWFLVAGLLLCLAIAGGFTFFVIHIETQMSAIRSELDYTRSRLDIVVSERDSANRDLASTKVDLATTVNNLASITAEKDGLSAQLTTAQSSIVKATADISRLNDKVGQLTAMMTPAADHAISQQNITGNQEFISTAWLNRDYELQNTVASIGSQYHTGHTYIANETDCDDMAVDLWNMLYTKGIKSVIVVGNLEKTNASFNEINHAWLWVFNAQGKYWIMEPTTGEAIFARNADGSVNPRAVPYMTGFFYKKPSDLWQDLKKKW
jgi:cytoskeletal protein RodZ